MSYSVPKLAVRDSFDDEDISDDVEDEVFIRDGRNGFKVDEERGVKRPLMAPRRKSKSNQLHSEIGRKPYRAFCAPCCYGFLALSALLGLITLVVSLVVWFPFPLDHMGKFWRFGQTGQTDATLVPCNDLVVTDVWTKNFPKLTVESAMRLNDVNGDGVMDIIMGFGTGADGRDVPDFVCTLYFGGIVPCLGGVMALDGRTGTVIWQHWSSHTVYFLDCSVDMTKDSTNDCLVSGKGGLLEMINGHDGSSLWQYNEPSSIHHHVEPQIDVFSARFIEDMDGDGLPDVLTTRTKNPTAETSLCGYLILLSGKRGTVLQNLETPNREESYYAPQLLVHPDGENIVLFGTGSQASAGGLYAIPLFDLVKGNTAQMQRLYWDTSRGIMSPPVLADINLDSTEDIVVAMFNSTVLAFNGLTFQPLWNYSFPDSETSSAATPAYFNDDNIPDFLVKYQKGPAYPLYFSSETMVIDGKNGAPLLDKPVVDSAGSQTGGISLSVEGLGNDLILYWIADCLHYEGSSEPFTFKTGSSVQSQSRADLCKLRFNSTLSTKMVALSQHLEPPGIVIYSSDQRKYLEYNNTVNTSAEANNYVQTHPDFWETHKDLKLKKKPEETDYRMMGSENGVSNFRHHEDVTSMRPGNGHYKVANRGRNRVSSNDAGEQEEILAAEFQGGSEYPNVRKHGSLMTNHPKGTGHRWPQQQGVIPINYGTMDEKMYDVPMQGSHDTDYDMLYGPVNMESLGSSQQGYPNEGIQPEEMGRRDERTLGQAVKRSLRMNRDVTNKFTEGLQRLTSVGTLAPPLWTSTNNDSIDLIFATYWIYPSVDAQVILAKDKDCMEKLRNEAEENKGKFHNLDADALEEAIKKECLGETKTPVDTNPFALDMGQATVYRLRLTCKCHTLSSSDRCSAVLPYAWQSWPQFMGTYGNGHFQPRTR